MDKCNSCKHCKIKYIRNWKVFTDVCMAKSYRDKHSFRYIYYVIGENEEPCFYFESYKANSLLRKVISYIIHFFKK